MKAPPGASGSKSVNAHSSETPAEASCCPVTRQRWADRSESLAAALVLLPFAIVCLATAGFATGFGIQTWYGPVAVGISLAFLCYGARRQPAEAVLRGGMLLGSVVIALCLGGLWGDLSFDSINYHQPCGAELRHGWNPWAEPSPGVFASDNIWVNHYPQASWINAAAATLVTGRIDTGKWINFVLAASAALAVFALLLRATRVKRGMAALLALLVAANPVTLCQIHTFYLDGTLGAAVTVFIAGLWFIIGLRRRSGWWLAAPALLLLINLKHTGVAYAVLLCATAVLAEGWSAGWQKAGKLGFALFALGIAGVGFLGYAPYVKNLRAGLHIFHPVLGVKMMDDFMGVRMTPNLPTNRVGAFFVSHFARADYPDHVARPAVSKFPFAISINECRPWDSPDVKTGGFGPLYGALMILSAGGAVALALSRRRARLGVALIAGAGLGIGIFCHDQAWWARYAPQAWLLVWIVPVVALDLPGRAWVIWRGCVLFLGVVNCGIVLIGSTAGQRSFSTRLDRVLTQAAEALPVALQVRRFPILAERFRERGIPFVMLEGDAAQGVVRHPIIGEDPECYWIKVPAAK